MAIRTIQASGIWFWLALVFFLFVVFNHSSTVLPNISGGRPASGSLQERLDLSERSWKDWTERRHEMRAGHPSPNNIPL